MPEKIQRPRVEGNALSSHEDVEAFLLAARAKAGHDRLYMAHATEIANRAIKQINTVRPQAMQRKRPTAVLALFRRMLKLSTFGYSAC